MEHPRRAGSESSSGTGSERALRSQALRRGSPPRARVPGCGHLPNGAQKPITPQYKGRVDTSTITASRIPIMYRMEAPNALRYLRRPTTLR